MSAARKQPPTSGVAITSLILGVLTLLMFWIPIVHLAPGLLAVILGTCITAYRFAWNME